MKKRSWLILLWVGGGDDTQLGRGKWVRWDDFALCYTPHSLVISSLTFDQVGRLSVWGWRLMYHKWKRGREGEVQMFYFVAADTRCYEHCSMRDTPCDCLYLETLTSALLDGILMVSQSHPATQCTLGLPIVTFSLLDFTPFALLLFWKFYWNQVSCRLHCRWHLIFEESTSTHCP